MSTLTVASLAALAMGASVAAPGLAATTTPQAAPAPATAGLVPAEVTTQGNTWGDCPEPVGAHEGVTVKCTTVSVAKDHDDPKQGEYDLTVSWAAASGGASRGTIVVSGGLVGAASYHDLDMHRKLPEDVRHNFDVIAFSQRGVSAAAEARCFSTRNEQDAIYDVLKKVPSSHTEELEYVEAAKKLSRACGEVMDDHLLESDLTAHARDLDSVRKSLGLHELNIFTSQLQGGVAQVHAELFPKTTRAVVVNDVVPGLRRQGDSTTSGQSLAERSSKIQASEDALRTLMEHCDEVGPSRCASAGEAGSKSSNEKLHDVMDALERGPIKYQMTYRYLKKDGTLDYEATFDQAFTLSMMRDFTYDAVYAGGSAAKLLTVQLQVLHRVLAGEKHITVNVPDASKAVAQHKRGNAFNKPEGSTKVVSDPVVDYNPIVDSIRTNTCNNANFSGDLASGRLRARQASSEFRVFGATLAWQDVYCHAWLDPKANPGAEFNAETEHPILFTTTEHSPNATDEAIQEATKRFPHAELLTIGGWGAAYNANNECADSAVSEYLSRLKTPDQASCASEEEIFNGFADVIPYAKG